MQIAVGTFGPASRNKSSSVAWWETVLAGNSADTVIQERSEITMYPFVKRHMLIENEIASWGLAL